MGVHRLLINKTKGTVVDLGKLIHSDPLTFQMRDDIVVKHLAENLGDEFYIGSDLSDDYIDLDEIDSWNKHL